MLSRMRLLSPKSITWLFLRTVPGSQLPGIATCSTLLLAVTPALLSRRASRDQERRSVQTRTCSTGPPTRASRGGVSRESRARSRARMKLNQLLWYRRLTLSWRSQVKGSKRVTPNLRRFQVLMQSWPQLMLTLILMCDSLI